MVLEACSLRGLQWLRWQRSRAPLKRVVAAAAVFEMGTEACELVRLGRGTIGGENLPPCQDDFCFQGSGGGGARLPEDEESER